MPSTSRRQQRFMYAELERKKEGKATETGMSESQLEDFTHLDKHKEAEKRLGKGAKPSPKRY